MAAEAAGVPLDRQRREAAGGRGCSILGVLAWGDMRGAAVQHRGTGANRNPHSPAGLVYACGSAAAQALTRPHSSGQC